MPKIRFVANDSMKAHFLLDSSDKSFENFRIQFEQLAGAWGLPTKTIYQVRLIVEELWTNFYKYASTGIQNPIEVSMFQSDRELLIVYEDSGPAFNPLEVAPPDTSLPLEKRQPGGLGLHLVRNYIDSYTYTREDKKNILNLKKEIK